MAASKPIWKGCKRQDTEKCRPELGPVQGPPVLNQPLPDADTLVHGPHSEILQVMLQ